MASKIKSYVAKIRGTQAAGGDGGGGGGAPSKATAEADASSRFFTTCEMCLSIRAAVRAEDAFCSDACSKKALNNAKPRRDNSLTNMITLNNPEFQKIHAHARWNRQEELAVLLKNGCPIDLPDANKNTPLIVASQNGHLPLVRYLVEAGAKVNLQNMLGNTAAHFAKMYGYDEVYNLLVENGADVTLKNSDGVTADAVGRKPTGREPIVSSDAHPSTGSDTGHTAPAPAS